MKVWSEIDIINIESKVPNRLSVMDEINVVQLISHLILNTGILFYESENLVISLGLHAPLIKLLSWQFDVDTATFHTLRPLCQFYVNFVPKGIYNLI